jgi:acetylornithine deacetylase/succinyl-diaminopimelate desuccinylase family protein
MNASYEVDLLSRLVAIESNAITKSGYFECSELVRREAEELGLRTRIYDSRDFSDDKKTRPNVVIDLDVGADETVLLAAHYDVVPAGTGWKRCPFKMELVGDRAYGRGTSDDKGAIAAAFSAMKELSQMKGRVNISLLVTPDEEVGGKLGLGYLVNEVGIKGDAAVILDSGPEMVSIGASGVVWGKVLIRGKQGHAGYPHLAINAIDASLPLLQRVAEYSKIREKIRSRIPAPPGSPHNFVYGRFSLTMLKSGEKENIVPGLCEARFDMRVNPDEDVADAKRKFRRYFSRLVRTQRVRASLEFIQSNSSYFTDPNDPVVKRFLDAVRLTTRKTLPLAGELGGNDGHYFARAGIPVVCFGPSRSDTRVHGVDEFVYINDLINTRKTIVNLCKHW